MHSRSEKQLNPERRDSIVLVLFATLVILVFAAFGPTSALGLAAVAVPILFVIPQIRASYFFRLYPLAGLLLLIPPMDAYRVFDAVFLLFLGAAFLRMILAEDRRVWNLQTAESLCLFALAIPLLALPKVASMASFVAGYRDISVPIFMFLALMNLVRPKDASWILYIFPVFGIGACLQFLLKVQGVGGSLFSRLTFRNFYTDLGWGSSNYIAAVLLLCLCGTLLLAVLNKRKLIQLVLLGASILMAQVIFMTLSRGATVALAVYLLFLGVSLGGVRSLFLLGLVGALAVLIAATPAGQAVLFRFVDPNEQSSVWSRMEIWGAAWGRFLAEPLTGIGLNQGRYQQDILYDANPHNIMLTYLSEQGFVGGVFVLAVTIILYRISMSSRHTDLKGKRDVPGIMSAALLTAVISHALIEPTIPSYVMGVLFAWYLAWLTLRVRERQVSPLPQENPATASA